MTSTANIFFTTEIMCGAIEGALQSLAINKKEFAKKHGFSYEKILRWTQHGFPNHECFSYFLECIEAELGKDAPETNTLRTSFDEQLRCNADKVWQSALSESTPQSQLKEMMKAIRVRTGLNREAAAPFLHLTQFSLKGREVGRTTPYDPVRTLKQYTDFASDFERSRETPAALNSDAPAWLSADKELQFKKVLEKAVKAQFAKKKNIPVPVIISSLVMSQTLTKAVAYLTHATFVLQDITTGRVARTGNTKTASLILPQAS